MVDAVCEHNSWGRTHDQVGGRGRRVHIFPSTRYQLTFYWRRQQLLDIHQHQHPGTLVRVFFRSRMQGELIGFSVLRIHCSFKIVIYGVSLSLSLSLSLARAHTHTLSRSLYKYILISICFYTHTHIHTYAFCIYIHTPSIVYMLPLSHPSTSFPLFFGE